MLVTTAAVTQEHNGCTTQKQVHSASSTVWKAVPFSTIIVPLNTLNTVKPRFNKLLCVT